MRENNPELQATWSNSEAPRRWLLTSLATVVLSALLVASNLGCGGGGGLSSFGSAAELPEFQQGVYSPYYATGEMNIPRYLHDTLNLGNGLLLMAGGSDENGLSSIDTMEIFDQSTLKKDESPPPSITGTWIDTNFEGDPIALQVGRIYFTMTELPNDKVLFLGGTPNLALGREIDIAELYDPLLRTVEELEEKLVTPRFRHTATALPGGRVLIAGGQFYQQFTISEDINVNGGGNFGSGQVQFQQQIDTFPSLKTNEFYSVAEDNFFPLEILDTGRPAELTTRRGRSGHVVSRFAGPDDNLNTGDDLFLLVGGFMTLSGENAPNSKGLFLTGAGRQTGLTTLEYYDPIIEVFTRVPGLSLIKVRVNGVQAANLGQFNQTTPDGVTGLGNVILVANGDNDIAPLGWETSVDDEVIIATYTGFGPSQGLQMFRQVSANAGHSQGTEYMIANGGPGFGELDGTVEGNPGRTATEIAPIARRIENDYIETAVYNLGGVALAWIPGVAQIIYSQGTIAAGVVFDPMYNLDAVIDFETDARDLRIGRIDPRNPFGVSGTWLLIDGDQPTNSLDGFGTTPPGDLPSLATLHHWTQVEIVAGPDGVDGSPDDRPIVLGGGTEVENLGGSPSVPSTEFLIQPGQGIEDA